MLEGEAQKHMDPTDPDPQHYLKLCVYLNAVSFAAKRALISSRRAVEAAGSGFCDVLVRIRSTRSRSRRTVPVLRSSNTSCLASYRLKKVPIGKNLFGTVYFRICSHLGLIDPGCKLVH
jgi:hypothetical protein